MPLTPVTLKAGIAGKRPLPARKPLLETKAVTGLVPGNLADRGRGMMPSRAAGTYSAHFIKHCPFPRRFSDRIACFREERKALPAAARVMEGKKRRAAAPGQERQHAKAAPRHRGVAFFAW